MKRLLIESCCDCIHYKVFNGEMKITTRVGVEHKVVGICTHPKLMREGKHVPDLEIVAVNGKVPSYIPGWCNLEEA